MSDEAARAFEASFSELCQSATEQHPARLFLGDQELSSGQASVDEPHGSALFVPHDGKTLDTPLPRATLKMLDTGQTIFPILIEFLCQRGRTPHYHLKLERS